MSYTEQEYEEFEKRMHERFPEMFSKPYGGFAVGKGWWKIIESLCANIQAHIDWKNERKETCNQGDGCEQVVVAQIKEKFGGLRFYYEGGDEFIQGMVRMSEAWAANTCEVCGEPGVTVPTYGWVSTLCEKHRNERLEIMKND